jgi:methionyl-tRNA synthetase
MNLSSILGNNTLTFGGGALLTVLVIWSLIWKGLALWKAARRHDTAWFVLFMFLNTLGILEIIYYYLIAKGSDKVTPPVKLI